MDLVNQNFCLADNVKMVRTKTFVNELEIKLVPCCFWTELVHNGLPDCNRAYRRVFFQTSYLELSRHHILATNLIG